MVGELIFSFDLYRHCFLPLAHPHPFTFPHHFSFKNMRYFKALFFSPRERMFASHGHITGWSMSCCSSFISASAPFCLNWCKPLLADICVVRKLWSDEPHKFSSISCQWVGSRGNSVTRYCSAESRAGILFLVDKCRSLSFDFRRISSWEFAAA